MTLYSRDEKILIIPIGESYIDGSISTTPCEWAEKQAYESGWTEGYYSGITKDCGEAIEEAYTSGWSGGYEAGFDSASTKEIGIRFYFNEGQIAIYNRYSRIIVNGNSDTQLTYFEVTGDFNQYDAHFLTSEQSASTIELWIDYQNNGGYDVNPVTEFLAIKEYDALNIPILSQSMEYIGEPEINHKVYKYTFTVQNTPLYDKDSFEAGLSCCQGIDNIISISEETNSTWIYSNGESPRFLLINGGVSPYPFSTDGTAGQCQWDLISDEQITMEVSSFTFTVDVRNWISEIPVPSSCSVFGVHKTFTYTAEWTTGHYDSSNGIRYTITITGNQ